MISITSLHERYCANQHLYTDTDTLLPSDVDPRQLLRVTPSTATYIFCSGAGPSQEGRFVKIVDYEIFRNVLSAGEVVDCLADIRVLIPASKTCRELKHAKQTIVIGSAA